MFCRFSEWCLEDEAGEAQLCQTCTSQPEQSRVGVLAVLRASRRFALGSLSTQGVQRDSQRSPEGFPKLRSLSSPHFPELQPQLLIPSSAWSAALPVTGWVCRAHQMIHFPDNTVLSKYSNRRKYATLQPHALLRCFALGIFNLN